MEHYIEKHTLQIDQKLVDFIETEVLQGLPLTPDHVWQGLAKLLDGLTNENRALLAHRDTLQNAINRWHIEHNNQPHDPIAYAQYLRDIGYIVPEDNDFTISTCADAEIATIAAPQLVVPANNARYALNAVNARWGSLYDALYGTDALGRAPTADELTSYCSQRGNQVIAWGRDFLDTAVPLCTGKWEDVCGFAIVDQQITIQYNNNGTNSTTHVQDSVLCIGYQGNAHAPSAVIFQHHGLHILIAIDHQHPVGQTDAAGISDIRLESAVSTIIDGEDSVAAVDSTDKINVYRNWLGLMRGDLVDQFEKNGRRVERTLANDIDYSDLYGHKRTLKARALMLIRNVGHLMTTPMVRDQHGQDAYEGIVDALLTSLIALHDLNKPSTEPKNSALNSVYIVKPKMHGADEVLFANTLFRLVEDILHIPENTLKIGLMDEERRTSLNLKECIGAVQHRIAFINTGFLDRTGDDIHTSMEAGAVLRKSDMKHSVWLQAYEKQNVAVGLACGFQGKAQIGKGMWAMPDRMRDMLAQKGAHPVAGANCAWVPSPTAAVLHATHYHYVNVSEVQTAMLALLGVGDTWAKGFDTPYQAELLTLPLLPVPHSLSNKDITAEVENNAQGILGYVVRWVDQGIGCSKVLDIHDIGLMEDRATCRISSQHIANWLHHNLISREHVIEILKKMARIVDRQNSADPHYTPMAEGFDNSAFQAACDLVFMGGAQPSGYTEPILHQRRTERKKTL